MALLPGLPQMSGLAAMDCSLIAFWAWDTSACHFLLVSCCLTQVSAHNGRELSSDSLHGVIEFCTMALQRTLVVYRAYKSDVLDRSSLLHPIKFLYLLACQSGLRTAAVA